MSFTPDIQPLLAWDGGRHVAVAIPAAAEGAVLTLIAHGPESADCAAVWELAAGLCIALLPEHAPHLDLHITVPGGETAVIAVELDSQLSPAIADPEQPGLSWISFDTLIPKLASGGSAAAGLVSLNLATVGPSGLRMKAGPLTDLAADRGVTDVTLDSDGAGLTLSLARPGGPSPVLAALIPADPAALAALPPDAGGAAGDEAAERGFALVAPEPTSDGGQIVIRAFGTGDRLLLAAPRQHRIRFGAAGKPGTRLLVTGEAPGSLSVALTTHAYRPATSTALAALGGVRGKALSAAGGATRDLADLTDQAAALAEALWKRQRLTGDAPTPWLEDAARARAPAGLPLARLTQAAAGHADAGVSPLTAAMGAALKLPPAQVEEIEQIAALPRAALAQWTALDPAVAASAIGARVILPPPSDSAAGREAARVLAAATDPAFASRALAVADHLGRTAATADRRTDVARLREAADGARADWLDLAALAAAVTLVEANAAPPASAATRLLGELRADAAGWAAAQREAQSADLADIAERRAMIPSEAREAGLPTEAAADIEAKLPTLSTADIILLHRHLAAAVRRQALVRSVRQAVLVLDAAAGAGGLAARKDRAATRWRA